MRFLVALGLGMLLAGCSNRAAPACTHTWADISVQDRAAAPACDCRGPAGTDQLCTPGPADGHFFDVTVDVTDAVTLTDAGTDCCSAPDPCGLAHNGACDCDGLFAWDDWDCFLAPVDTYLTDGNLFGDTDAGSCCTIWDPCEWANDGVCDCGGQYEWDDHDCSGVVLLDAVSLLDGDAYSDCCSPSDPCDWANDYICDCGGQFEWDNNDCTGYSDADVYFFDIYYGGDAVNCCTLANLCDWANDGYCDCGGQFEWDKHDCMNITDAIVFLDDVIYSDADDCCTEENPCDWADDGYCDCEGKFAWDNHDCVDPDQ